MTFNCFYGVFKGFMTLGLGFKLVCHVLVEPQNKVHKVH